MQSVVVVEDGVTWTTREGCDAKVLDSYAEYQRWAPGPLMTKGAWETRQREVHSLVV